MDDDDLNEDEIIEDVARLLVKFRESDLNRDDIAWLLELGAMVGNAFSELRVTVAQRDDTKARLDAWDETSALIRAETMTGPRCWN